MRELQNLVRNVVVLHNAEVVTVEMLGFDSMSSSAAAARDRRADGSRYPGTPIPEPKPSPTALGVEIGPLWRMEMQCIEHALKAAGGSVPRAAAMLEISPSTIYRKRQSWRSHGAHKTETADTGSA